MRGYTHLRRCVLGASAALALGCGNIEGPSGAQGGSGRGGASGASGAGGGGGGGRSGAGGAGAAGGGTALDAGQEAGSEAGSGGGGGGLPAHCPVPAPVPSEGQVFIIQSVNFDTSVVVLKNVSGIDQTIEGGRQGWQWCHYPNYWNVILTEEDVVVPPGRTFSFVIVNNTQGVWPLDREGGELGIITETGGFTTEEFYRAFVSWNGAEQRREPTAVKAGLWTYEERIELRDSDAGFMIVGEAKRGAGYASVPADCLVAPPNP